MGSSSDVLRQNVRTLNLCKSCKVVQNSQGLVEF